MKVKYLIRLDDACATMDSEKWGRVENILYKHNIKPMVGIIPNNKDKGLMINETDIKFWDKARKWKAKEWTIALHGYDHVYISENSGINPVHNRSEFAGVGLELQKEKLRKGFNILKDQDLIPQWFFAPSHTFDNNTLSALKSETTIRKISDTFALSPYKYKEFTFLPQQMGTGRDIKIKGIWTFCYHPNTMDKMHLIIWRALYIGIRIGLSPLTRL